MQTPSPAALVRAAQSGDRQALDALLGEYLPLVYNVVGRALHGDVDVDDVVQETMLRVVQRLGDLREPERFRSWLIAIAVRQVQERGRAHSSATRRHQPLDLAPEPPDPSAEFTDEALTRLGLSSVRRDVVEAGRWLSETDRQILALWWQEAAGMLSRADVATALALTPQHTAVRIQRMRAQLDLARGVLSAWQTRPRCAALSETARRWDRTADPRWLRRLGRHVRSCERCRLAATTATSAETLRTVGPLPLPAALTALPSLLASSGIGPTIANLGLSGAAVTGLGSAATAGLGGAGTLGSAATAGLGGAGTLGSTAAAGLGGGAALGSAAAAGLGGAAAGSLGGGAVAGLGGGAIAKAGLGGGAIAKAGLGGAAIGKAGVGGGLPVLPLLRRVWEAWSAKSAAIAGTAAAGVATAMVLAVHYTPAEQPDAAPPSAPVTAPGASSSPTPSGSPRPAPAPATSVNAVPVATFYVAPDGSDTAPGTQAQPFATVGKAASVVGPGQTIALRGGVYQPTEPVRLRTSGTAAKRITLTGYGDERPIIDASRIPSQQWFLTHEASYWTVRGLEIRNAPNHSYVCVSCAHTIFERLSIHDGAGIGLLLRGAGTTGNQVRNSDFYANHDTADLGGTADGLAFKYGSGTGNSVTGCRMFHNSADGLDLSNFTDPVSIDRSWAFGNGVDRWNIAGFTGGGNGFKLGGGDPAPAVGHVVTHSAAWDNTGYGFTESGNPGGLRLLNDTAFRNTKAGFAFVHSRAQLRHNLALANDSESWLGEFVDHADNSWNETGWSTTDLRSGDATIAQGARQQDGSLPATTFLMNRRDPATGAAMKP